ncbi:MULTISPECIES: hypothetical protein [Parachlamydia]|jgi:hypothetical protein|uniref:Transmembrane protein n=1 Tax=Parachlamydia acanthamoebae (strain UV7) TaxID=765952 RepID=F8L1E4_PARAV|nr:hypothetical protein [Parachlamydia acanthamoebae]CCB87084.1 unknown protein [Parachlamydia acanthamoebae UV-7]
MNPIRIQADEAFDDETNTEIYKEMTNEETCDVSYERPMDKVKKCLFNAALLAATGVGGYYIGKDNNNHTKMKVVKPTCPECPVCPTAQTVPFAQNVQYVLQKLSKII